MHLFYDMKLISISFSHFTDLLTSPHDLIFRLFDITSKIVIANSGHSPNIPPSGEVVCCFTDGCNSNVDTAKRRSLLLPYTSLHCTVLYCTALHCTALHGTAAHYITHPCTALQTLLLSFPVLSSEEVKNSASPQYGPVKSEQLKVPKLNSTVH